MKLNIDVELDSGYEGRDLDQQVIDAIATKLIHGAYRGSNRLDALRTKAEAEIKKRIRESVDERIEKICDEILSEDIAVTDDYGRPKGEPKKFHDLIKDQIVLTLSSRNYGLQNRLSSIVGKALANELRESVKAQIKKLEASMDEEFYAQIADTFKKKAGIK